MYRYGAMVINLSRRSFCDVGVCMSILTVCGYMCLCICVSAAQYHSITSLNVGQLSQNFIYRKPVIYAESREKHSENILAGVCTGTLRRGS